MSVLGSRRMHSRFWHPTLSALSFVAAIVANGIEAKAFDDADCERLQTVPISVDEDIRSFGEGDQARRRALDRAGQLATAQVIGFKVQSSREIHAEAVNNDAIERYNNVEKSFLDGLVRIKLLEEVREVRGSRTVLSLRTEVAVCVPKQEVLLRAERDKAERERRPPKRIDPTQAVFFNPLNGLPQTWFGRSVDQQLEFFDNSGFHPDSGERLQPVDRKIIAEWRATAAKRLRDAAERGEREREESRQAALRQEQFARAPELCDQLAANPYDLDKPKDIPGASYDALKANVDDAVRACEGAVARQPSERRYRYQLARAYSATDPKRAMPLFQVLAGQRYRAAFDNYGWAFLDRRVGRNDMAGAVAAFRRGVEAGDPDSMHSLATLIAQGRVPPGDPGETLRLYQRAAQLGHREAALAVQSAVDAQNQARLQQQQQQEAARMFMGVIGGVLNGARR